MIPTPTRGRVFMAHHNDTEFIGERSEAAAATGWAALAPGVMALWADTSCQSHGRRNGDAPDEQPQGEGHLECEHW